MASIEYLAMRRAVLPARVRTLERSINIFTDRQIRLNASMDCTQTSGVSRNTVGGGGALFTDLPKIFRRKEERETYTYLVVSLKLFGYSPR